MPKLVFIHMPKCAGRSVIDLLNKNYTNVLQMNNIPLLATMTIDEIDAYDLVAGHIAYQYMKIFNQFKCMTILRDPLERTISQYNHFMTMNTSVEEAEILKLHNYTFLDFVSTSNPNLSLWTNIYTVQLGDEGSVIYNIKEYLKRAIIALGEMDFIGIYEQWDETIDTLKAKYHLKGDVVHLGNTPKINKVAQLSEEDVQTAKKYLIPDYILYNMAKDKFNETYMV
jgi:hypothetical protein